MLSVWQEKKIAVRPKFKVGDGGFLAHILNVFKVLVLLLMFKILRRVHFLANTQYAGKNFYRLLSRRAKIFTAYSVCRQ
jgi:hypothetical protein